MRRCEAAQQPAPGITRHSCTTHTAWMGEGGRKNSPKPPGSPPKFLRGAGAHHHSWQRLGLGAKKIQSRANANTPGARGSDNQPLKARGVGLHVEEVCVSRVCVCVVGAVAHVVQLHCSSSLSNPCNTRWTNRATKHRHCVRSAAPRTRPLRCRRGQRARAQLSGGGLV